MQAIGASRNRTAAYIASIAISICAALIALAPSIPLKLTLAAPLLLLPIVWWSLLEAQRWLLLFLCALVVLPPLPIPLGDSGPHPALACFAFGLFVCAFRLHRWKTNFPPVTR